MDEDVRNLLVNDYDEVKNVAILLAIRSIEQMPVELVLQKFDRGRREHNEDLSKLDTHSEIEKETQDLIAYTAIGLCQDA